MASIAKATFIIHLNQQRVTEKTVKLQNIQSDWFFLTQNHKVGISSNGLRDQSHEATLSILYLSPIISGEEFKK